MTPETALQAAIVTILRDAGALDPLIGDKVFDEVPETAAPPYIYLGPINRTRFETGCDPLWTVRMRLYVISEDFGRLQGWDVIDAMARTLEGQFPDLSASGHAVQEPIRVIQAGDVVDPQALKSMFLDVTAVVARVS